VLHTLEPIIRDHLNMCTRSIFWKKTEHQPHALGTFYVN
jgi:hypothetical protein